MFKKRQCYWCGEKKCSTRNVTHMPVCWECCKPILSIGLKGRLLLILRDMQNTADATIGRNFQREDSESKKEQQEAVIVLGVISHIKKKLEL